MFLGWRSDCSPVFCLPRAWRVSELMRLPLGSTELSPQPEEPENSRKVPLLEVNGVSSTSSQPPDVTSGGGAYTLTPRTFAHGFLGPKVERGVKPKPPPTHRLTFDPTPTPTHTHTHAHSPVRSLFQFK